jgi:hypothetical protein
VRHRADQLGLLLDDDQVKRITAEIKAMSDERPLTLDDVDSLLRAATVVGELVVV